MCPQRKWPISWASTPSNSGRVLLSTSVSKRAIFLRLPSPVKKAFALVERFEPSITKTPVRGKPHISPSVELSEDCV